MFLHKDRNFIHTYQNFDFSHKNNDEQEIHYGKNNGESQYFVNINQILMVR